MKKLALFSFVAGPLLALAMPLAALAAPMATTTYTVTINAYVDGQPATTATTSAGAAVFPMQAVWNAKNIGKGKGNYDLSASGYNGDPTPYQAVTTPLIAGAYYDTRVLLATTNKDTGTVGATCNNDTPYMLEGYSHGTSPAEAASSTIGKMYPMFHHLSQNQYVIVWTRHCLTAPVGISPKGGTTASSSDLTSITWTTVSSPFGTVSYYYEASNASTTNKDGSFTAPVYQSGALSSPMIATGGTPPATYYWHVKAVDSVGNSSEWSDTRKIIVN